MNTIKNKVLHFVFIIYIYNNTNIETGCATHEVVESLNEMT